MIAPLQTSSCLATIQGPVINTHLWIIFAFVLALVLIVRVFRYFGERMWHETARRALEKGQPLPDPTMMRSCRGRRFVGRSFAYWELRRGIVLLAVSAGLYFALDASSRAWVAIPACIGAANLIMGLIAMLRGEESKPEDNSNLR